MMRLVVKLLFHKNKLDAIPVCFKFNFLIRLILIDIYISCVSNSNQVAPKTWYIANVSTTVETQTPEAEIQPALQLLGAITEKYLFNI